MLLYYNKVIITAVVNSKLWIQEWETLPTTRYLNLFINTQFRKEQYLHKLRRCPVRTMKYKSSLKEVQNHCGFISALEYSLLLALFGLLFCSVCAALRDKVYCNQGNQHGFNSTVHTTFLLTEPFCTQQQSTGATQKWSNNPRTERCACKLLYKTTNHKNSAYICLHYKSYTGVQSSDRWLSRSHLTLWPKQ